MPVRVPQQTPRSDYGPSYVPDEQACAPNGKISTLQPGHCNKMAT